MRHVCLGIGPRPRIARIWSCRGRSASNQALIRSTAYRHRAGIATSRAIGTTSLTVVGASASRRNRTRSSPQPSSGANTAIATSAASHTGHPSPVLSWKNRKAVAKAIAPWAKLKIPDVWYVRTIPEARTAYRPPATAPPTTRFQNSTTFAPL